LILSVCSAFFFSPNFCTTNFSETRISSICFSFFSFLFESFGPAVLQSSCQVVILVSRLVNVLNLGKVLVLMMMIWLLVWNRVSLNWSLIRLVSLLKLCVCSSVIAVFFFSWILYREPFCHWLFHQQFLKQVSGQFGWLFYVL
jgi:hypothetical protein